MTPTPNESLLSEIHRVRREISDRFGGDVAAIAEDAARRQAVSNRPIWQPRGNKYLDVQGAGVMLPKK